MIYLNYAATTPILKSSLQTMYEINEKYYSLASMNKECLSLEQQAKEVILQSFEAKEHQVMFTNSGSYANNTSIVGYASKYQTKKHFITTKYEHSSMLEAFKTLETMGHEVTYLTPNSEGIIKAETVVKEIRDNTVLVSIIHLNNELGTFNDVNYIFSTVKNINSNICTVSDMCQSVGKLTINLTSVDIMTYTAHKIYGPKECGVIVYKKNIELKPTITSHTMSIATIVTTAKVTRQAIIDSEKNNKRLTQLTEYVKAKIAENEKLQLNVNSSSNIFSIYVMVEMLSESVVNYMADNNIEISTKSACSTKDKTVSNSLKALDLDNERLNKTIRLSISHLTTYDELDVFFKTLKQLTHEE